MSKYSLPLSSLVVLLLVVAGVALPAQAASDTVSRFLYASQPGYTVGDTGSGSVSSLDATFTAQGDAHDVIISVNGDITHFWSVELAAPSGDTLHTGDYPLAVAPAQRTGTSPGLRVAINGSSCNQTFGSFTVNRIAFDATGQITELDADFVEHCESSTAPPVVGIIQYQLPATDPAPTMPVPPPAPDPSSASLTYTGEPGGPIQPGSSGQFDASNALLFLTGDVHGVTLNVWPDGNRSGHIEVSLMPPSGQDLQKGTYDTAVNIGPADGEAVFAETTPLACAQEYASFTIHSIHTDGWGQVDGIDASFVRRCNSSTGPAMWGVVHFGVDPATASPMPQSNPAPLPPADSSFRYVSAAGAPLAGGSSGTFEAPNTTFSITGSAQKVEIMAMDGSQTWDMTFAAPSGQTLESGDYTAVWPSTNTLPAVQPGMALSRRESQTQDVCRFNQGTFTVYQIHSDRYGQVDSAEIGFTIWCRVSAGGELEPPIAGIIRYRVAQASGPDTPTLPATPPGRVPTSLVIPAVSFSPATLDVRASGDADNAAADHSPFRAFHSTTFENLGRTRGSLQVASSAGTGYTALGSVYSTPQRAKSAFGDSTLGPGGRTNATDCSNWSGTSCSLGTLVIQQNAERAAILEYNTCTIELLYTAPRGNGSITTMPDSFIFLISSAGETLQTACAFSDGAAKAQSYAFTVKSPHVVACRSTSGSSCTHARVGTARRGARVSFSYAFAVTHQPKTRLYLIAETVQPPGARVTTHSRIASRVKTGTVLTGTPIRLSRAGTWSFAVTVTAPNGKREKASAALHVTG
jgi:hypothetical protein